MTALMRMIEARPRLQRSKISIDYSKRRDKSERVRFVDDHENSVKHFEVDPDVIEESWYSVSCFR